MRDLLQESMQSIISRIGNRQEIFFIHTRNSRINKFSKILRIRIISNLISKNRSGTLVNKEREDEPF